MNTTFDPLFSVEDKVVLVTGGSRGLGAAISRGLAERGARVIIASRKLDSCQALAEELTAQGLQAIPLQCHVGQWATLDKVVEQAVSQWGRLDALVNNAGMSPLAPSLLETTELLVDKILGVNFKGPLRLTALAATEMAATGGGSVVNISSLASLRPSTLTTVYAAAKAGLNALTKASAEEFAPVGVRVNGIICGTFETDAASHYLLQPEILAMIESHIGLKRVGRPDEVVGAIVYLLSNAASYTTGSLMTVDGGTAS